ncbi:MAG TPA: hypothetical protein VF857_10285, partial [Spirochaetota bacterium]
MTTSDTTALEEDLSFSEEELDRIRKKTFTRELRDLVDKVVFDAGGEPVPQGKTVPDYPDADQIRNLHSLFYRTINLDGHDSIYTGFNPFISRDDNIFEYAKDYIRKSLLKIDVSEYAILFYDPSRKSFS